MYSYKNNQATFPPAIVFDFGGVLIDWNPRYLYQKLFNGDEQAVEKFLTDVEFFDWVKLQDAGMPFVDAVAYQCARYPKYCDLIRAYDERYLETIRGAIEGSVEILNRLHQSNYSLFALSNWPEEKYRLVRPLHPFMELFDEIVISGIERIAKPDPLIFHVLLERIGRPAGECLFIDDSASNISVAKSLGFQAIHFYTSKQLEDSLYELDLFPA